MCRASLNPSNRKIVSAAERWNGNEFVSTIGDGGVLLLLHLLMPSPTPADTVAAAPADAGVVTIMPADTAAVATVPAVTAAPAGVATVPTDAEVDCCRPC